jgi:hypothetical protein
MQQSLLSIRRMAGMNGLSRALLPRGSLPRAREYSANVTLRSMQPISPNAVKQGFTSINERTVKFGGCRKITVTMVVTEPVGKSGWR